MALRGALPGLWRFRPGPATDNGVGERLIRLRVGGGGMAVAGWRGGMAVVAWALSAWRRSISGGRVIGRQLLKIRPDARV